MFSSFFVPAVWWCKWSFPRFKIDSALLSETGREECQRNAIPTYLSNASYDKVIIKFTLSVMVGAVKPEHGSWLNDLRERMVKCTLDQVYPEFLIALVQLDISILSTFFQKYLTDKGGST